MSSAVAVAPKSAASPIAPARTQLRASLPDTSAAKAPAPKVRSRAPSPRVTVWVPPFEAARRPIQPRVASWGFTRSSTPKRIRPTATPVTRFRMHLRKTQAIFRQHRGLVILLGAAVVVHLAAWIAYWPGLWYSDSVSYADLAVHGGISPTRQMAYPWIMRALVTVGGQTDVVLGFLTATQHLAALVVGVLIYAMLRWLDVARPLALVGGAVFLLDAFSLSVEQTILSESFYTLALTGSFALLVLRRGHIRALVLSGLLLAGAVWLRSAGLFAIPAWLAYVVLTTRAWRPALTATAALAVPLLVYATLYWTATGVFGFTQTKGWFMYGRVAEIANCKTADIPPGTKRLCPRPPVRVGAAWYIWDWHSPAWKLYGRNPGGDPARLERFDNKLGRFATAVIKDDPLRYGRLVLADLGRFFEPGLMTRGDNDDLTTTFGRYDATQNLRLPSTRKRMRTFDDYRTPERFPAPLLKTYSKVVHLPRLPLAAILLAALAGVVVPQLRRNVEHPTEVALLTIAGASILLGHALTSDFAVRYLIPTVPLILAGGIPGSRWLLAAVRPARASSAAAAADRSYGDPSSPAPERASDRGTYRPPAAPDRSQGRAGSAR